LLSVGVVTKPFQFEGANRMRIAEAGIEEMQQFVDTLIVIPNQNLFRIANEKTTFADAFAMADDVLHSGVRGVTDLMVVPGLINLDFADIRAVMSEMGKAMMGTGEADGDDRAKRAAEAAISNPLLDDVSMKGARGVLINITGGNDMTLFEVDEAANRIGDEVDPDANIIFGSTLDPDMDGRLRVSVVATGIDLEASVQPRPVLKVYSEPALTVVTEIPAPALKPVPALPDAPAHAPTDAAADDTEAAANAPEQKPMQATAEVEIDAPETESDDQDIPDAVPAAGESPQARPVAAETAAETPFIPPPPAEPNSPGHAGVAPDPFKEADLINGGKPVAERRRGPNLFQRIKASSRARREAPETPENQDKHAAIPAPAAMAPAAPKPAAPPAQTRLDGVDRIAHANAAVQSEEDLLEIPAFLRRQAN